MEFKGRYTIPATPQRVWDALHDETVLARSIPGCEEVKKISDNEFKARAKVKIGPVSAPFEGRVQIMPGPPKPGFSHAFTMRGEGQGGAAGFARGESDVRLAPDVEGKTTLEYEAKAIVGGRLAQLGQRLIDGAAKSIADEFFAKFAAGMGANTQSRATPDTALPEPAAVVREGLSPQIWVVGLIAIVISLLIVFSLVL
jgi:carbon monoxide dehydrogenase subunit G